MNRQELEAKRYQDTKDRERLDDLTTVTPFKEFGEPSAPNKAQHSPYVGPPEPSVFSHELDKAIRERDQARAHASKLAEALRECLCAGSTHSKTVAWHKAESALAAWEAAQ